MEEILVFGHKNPDTDSICSSIAMSNLRKQQGFNAIPCRLGEINKETKFVLDKLGVKSPKLLKTVSAQITDLNYVEKSTISTEDSIKEALDLMTKENFSSLPVIDTEGYFKTMLSISDIANTYLEIDYSDLFSKYSTTFENLKEALEGEVISGNYPEGEIASNLKEASELESLKKGDIVITTSLTDGIDKSIQAGARVVIVCCRKGDFISPRVTSECAIMLVRHSFFKAISLISQSISVGGILNTNKVLFNFNKEDFLNEIRGIMKDANQTNFPVLEDDGKVYGTIRTKHLIDFHRKKVIMVDHNEFSQSVEGIQDAHILEVVDHHKFANFQTNEATKIRTEPVGCTSTIVYGLYKEAKIEPDEKTALLMLSAILSDTLLFKSPTCTSRDVEVAKELAKLAKVDNISEYGMEMLVAGTSMAKSSMKEIINQDKKIFPIGDMEIAVAQINTVQIGELVARKEEIAKEIEHEIGKYGYSLFLFVVTDIINSNSLVFTYGKEIEIVENAFKKEVVNNEILLENVVSRKKQIIPFLMTAAQNM
ncbi:MAG: putative manganese-dependent inorganic diphosphatase [Fusobacterium sp.]|jgi:manganese-dependent inorganic pyrophosphatase|uniref:inorganic diphosphatase n=1 Tax=Fusobacterium pseudoperiodonticum TaxID=2663009 RepID=A0AAD0F2A8_9FUSO|nr:putative manganese-dependent inorganic diphosphatase [Fusobacterium pseudoperiodonticum]MBF0991723.1 putative manganese-dependent inorganic diphosphatase [Fusobacterium sp.]MBF1192199.1 putative manganese-dependent inorganic diphosphatase [Fusobacterium periodonticum]ATV36913.1 manganese-dependent inorganic pyrophosphatase [Fusobacterium pseudoperiodonticum]ATV62559.1 manganese-dependent inorganic pyrophosphatase [Fusobacterium pseudoperiodonticum]MBF1204171.1 putative manganese-dependent i